MFSVHLSLDSIKESAKNSAKWLFRSVFHLTKAKSLVDLASRNQLFDDYRTFRSWMHQSCIFLFHAMYLLRAVNAPFLYDLQALTSPAFGPFGYLSALGVSISSVELIILRIWLYLLTQKYQSMEGVKFIQLIKQLDKDTHDKMLYWTKVVSVLSLCASFNAASFWVGIQISNVDDLRQKIVGILLLAINYYCARIVLSDVLILYIYSMAGLHVVLCHMNALSQVVSQYNQFSYPMFAILLKYKCLIESIEQLNSLSRPLVLASEILVIPVASTVFLISATPSHDLATSIMKASGIILGVIYVLHGYFLIAILSQVETNSKNLHSQICSAIVNNTHGHWEQVVRLTQILEDISSHRSHLVVREFEGKVTQMDVFDSIISTVNTMVLLVFFKSLAY